MKVIGSDFDGTITTNKVILDSTREKIKEFRDKGNIFIIVTGRSVTKFKEGIKKYNIDFFDYVICSNGSIILDKKLKCIEKKTIGTQQVFKVLNLILDKKDKQIIVNTETESYFIMNSHDLLSLKDPVLSISIVFNSIKDRNEYFLCENNDISVYSNSIFTDIIAKDVSKAKSLLRLYSKIKGSVLYTIGDGENDISMLEITENSYTFESSIEKVKKSANYILPSIDNILDNINKTN